MDILQTIREINKTIDEYEQKVKNLIAENEKLLDENINLYQQLNNYLDREFKEEEFMFENIELRQENERLRNLIGDK